MPNKTSAYTSSNLHICDPLPITLEIFGSDEDGYAAHGE
jgi:hypothetical protein